MASVAGRVVSMRGHGKLRFVTIEDASSAVQLMFQADNLPAGTAAVEALVDLGDWVGAAGEVITSRRGELSVDVTGLEILSKALRPLPDKWHGLNAAETRYRQREVDLLANEESRRVFDIRFKTLFILRDRLEAQDFVEVETPILQPQAGGALARPFFTHANALDAEFSLRIAPELYLKRLVVGGYERVFEIARNFRNEGIDTRHSPEFTSLEAYRAFGDFHDGMDLTEHLIVAAAWSAAGRIEFDFAGQRVDLTPPWPRRDLLDMLWSGSAGGSSVHAGGGPAQDGARRRSPLPAVVGPGEADLRALRQGLDAPDRGSGVHLPLPDRGLAARPPVGRGSTLTDRFELVIGGRELANGYSELNDPDEQARRFQAEAAAAAGGDARLTRPTPPSCGRSSSGCRRHPASASASTGSSCSSPRSRRSATSSCSRSCGRRP